MGESESVQLPIKRFIEKLDDLEEIIKDDLTESVENIKETCHENRDEIKKMRQRSDKRWEKIQHHETILEDIDAETINTLRVLADAFQSLTESIISWLQRIFWFLVFGFITTILFPGLMDKLPVESFLTFLKVFGI